MLSACKSHPTDWRCHLERYKPQVRNQWREPPLSLYWLPRPRSPSQLSSKYHSISGGRETATMAQPQILDAHVNTLWFCPFVPPQSSAASELLGIKNCALRRCPDDPQDSTVGVSCWNEMMVWPHTPTLLLSKLSSNFSTTLLGNSFISFHSVLS